MRAEEQFDSFYLKSRRALVHQTFALTGDLTAAHRAVRDAYVSAWHHWRKVKDHDDPRNWVRPRAFAQAQRRHSARLWQRTRDLSPETRHVLDALHKLSGSERRALIMVHLAGSPLDAAARELNVTQEALERQLRKATDTFATALEIDPETVREPLASLGEASANISFPRPGAVRREGRNRRRTHTVVAAVAVSLLAVGSGAFAHDPGGPAATEAAPFESTPDVATEAVERAESSPESQLPSADDLLTPRDVASLESGRRWNEDDTHDNTTGEGINYPCQQERFADPEGLATLVRVLKASGKPARTVVQAVEISDSEDEAGATYSTVQSWVAGCASGGFHLRETYAVSGVGDRATLFELESWGSPRTTYSLGVTQVGQVVDTTVVRRVNAAPANPNRVARVLATTAEDLCERAGETDCAQKPKVRPTTPLPSGDPPGILATLDLPPMAAVKQPWVGTKPVSGAANPASTSCDRADFRKEGATLTRTRTFLVPEANLPDRFGLTETYGTFKTPKRAAAFMRTVRDRFAGCEDRDLATSVLAPRLLRHGPLDGSTWRLRTELSENRDVTFDVGFVRRGNAVAQLLFVPAGRGDLQPGGFRRLLVRAGQRLGELE